MAKTRNVNHLAHHKAMASKALMRNAVNRPGMAKSKIKASHAFKYHQSVMIAPVRKTTVNTARSDRAKKAQQSPYVSHFVMPSRSHFVPTPSKPITAIVHKPKVDAVQTFDQLMVKAIDNVEDQVLNLEQQPVRRLHRFTRSLVSNRFNGVALD